MNKTLLIGILFVLTTIVARSQDITLSGIVIDKADKSVISGATVKLVITRNASFQKMFVSDAKGMFIFENLSPNLYTIKITSVGYETISQKINLLASNKSPIKFILSKSVSTLADVTVTAKTPAIKQKEDTVEYAASEFKVNPDATAEDLVKKLPGITVDKSGNVTAMGESVQKVTVDGRDFLGDDATAALRNLPADVIDKIQVFDRLSDQAQFTGFDDGNSVKAINIVTKANMRKGSFGKFYAGAGTNNRYSAGGNYSSFNNNTRITVLGMSNNINVQNFSSQDLLGVSSGGRNSGASNFIGTQSGINSTNAFAVNYVDSLGKKTGITASYFFNNTNTNNNQVSNTEYYETVGANQLDSQNTLSNSKNFNHRINVRIDHKFDPKNSLLIVPSFSYQKNNSITNLSGTSIYTNGDSINNTINNNNTHLAGYSFNNSILYRHAFEKTGRTISINFSSSVNQKNGGANLLTNNVYTKIPFDILDSLNQFTNIVSNGYQLSTSIVYTETLSQKSQLLINYTPSYSKSYNDQELNQYDYVDKQYSIFDSALSNKFASIVTRQNINANYRIGSKNNMLTFGLAYLYTDLNSNETYPTLMNPIHKYYNNILPNLMWNKKFNTKSRIRIMFRSTTNTPSVTQLQNVYNNSNPLFQSVGNPTLKQQYTNTLATRYTFTNTGKEKTFFANLFLTQNSNYIGNATYTARKDSVLTSTDTLFKGSQLTKPINLNGYVNFRSFFTYAFPIKYIKSIVSLNSGYSFTITPGLVNDFLYKANSNTYSGGISISSNVSQYVDFTVLYNAAYNDVTNTNASLNSNYLTQTTTAQVNLLSKKGWFVNSDVTYQVYSGLSNGFNQNYWLWNASVGKKFLKNQQGELKLSAFDILKQNQSISRTVTEAYLQDLHSQVLQQYFLMTFTYKLKNKGLLKQPGHRDDGPPQYGDHRGGDGMPFRGGQK